MQQLLEEKEIALNDAASQIGNRDRENTELRAKAGRLQSEVDFLENDRYALVREKLTLQNKLGDFNSWPEFRTEYDQLTTEFLVMKNQRAREHILQGQTLQTAEETKVELAASKLAEAMSKIAQRKELEQVQQERDEAKEKYQTLLATTTITPAVTAATPVIKGESPKEIALQEENTRLTFALRSLSSLLSKKSSDLDRIQSLLKTGSEHSALQLKTAVSTIISLEENEAKAEERIAKLERDMQEANEKAEEMEERYMAVAFVCEVEGEKEVEQEEGSRGEKEEMSWLLKQILQMSEKRKEPGSTAGGSEAAGGSDGEDEKKEEKEGGGGGDDDDNEEGDDNDDEDGDGDDNNEEDMSTIQRWQVK